MSSKSRGWLVKNAVMAWLVNYAEKEAGELTKDYQALYNILDAEYEPQFDDQDEQLTTTKTQKRGRPAKRQRTKKASSNPSSTEENETTNQET
jgi:N-glycosylase/DNA lyase